MPHQETRESVKKKHFTARNAKGTNGACLRRCPDGKGFQEKNSCSHRWQAYLRASRRSDKRFYNWPAYEDLHGTGTVETSAKKKKRHVVPRWYRLTLAAPAEKAWDIGVGDNFKDKCTIPYWHNAHHLIPNSQLNQAIDDIGTGLPQPGQVRLLVRAGLLDVKYNLNEQVNMMILPMDEAIGRALKLPIHLRDPVDKWWECHGAYSQNVRKELDIRLRSLKRKLKKCEDRPAVDYGPYRDSLRQLSGQLRTVVRNAGAHNLDAIPEASFH